MKPQNFLEEDWDHAIIFDSARFDVFEKVYEDYFDGSLEKRKSKGSATPEWAHKVLEGRHNINWYSANPFINGKRKPLSEASTANYDTVPSRHIAQIIDLWDEAWDEKDGTVKPADVNEQFFKKRSNLADRRNVIHYMQPHVPFLGRGKGRLNGQIQKTFSSVKKKGLASDLAEGLIDSVPSVVQKVENTETGMKLGLYSSLDVSSLVKVIAGDSREKLMQYHEDSMRKAMEKASKLAEELDGDVVVTSDHGDAFGEQGVWGHHVETHIEPLVEVPWLELE